MIEIKTALFVLFMFVACISFELAWMQYKLSERIKKLEDKLKK